MPDATHDPRSVEVPGYPWRMVPVEDATGARVGWTEDLAPLLAALGVPGPNYDIDVNRRARERWERTTPEGIRWSREAAIVEALNVSWDVAAALLECQDLAA